MENPVNPTTGSTLRQPLNPLADRASRFGALFCILDPIDPPARVIGAIRYERVAALAESGQRSP